MLAPVKQNDKIIVTIIFSLVVSKVYLLYSTVASLRLIMRSKFNAHQTLKAVKLAQKWHEATLCKRNIEDVLEAYQMCAKSEE